MGFEKPKREKKPVSFLGKKCAELHYNVYAYISAASGTRRAGYFSNCRMSLFRVPAV